MGAVALAVSFAAAVPATGRERGTEVIFSLLAAVQVVTHLLFSVAASPLVPQTVPVAHLHSGLVPGAGMLVAHGLATVMTALWLSRGEAVLWALLRRLTGRLVLWMRVPHHTAYTAMAMGTHEPTPLRSALLKHSLSGRAPPPSPAG
jgi:hypothetical protein